METLEAALETIRAVAIGAFIINTLLAAFLAIKFVNKH